MNHLQMQPENNAKNDRMHLHKVTGSTLKQMLADMGLRPGGSKNNLPQCLFENILKCRIQLPHESGDPNFRDISAANNDIAMKSPNTYVWNKGAWLSFVTNITSQIDILGPLIWIW